MPWHRSFKIALIVAAALLASGATLAWAAGIVGGHRADHIGTFEPISRHLAPAGTPLRPTATTGRTTIATAPSTSVAPPTRDRTTTTTTGDDNGRHNDD
jgi:hypothetical protein